MNCNIPRIRGAGMPASLGGSGGATGATGPAGATGAGGELTVLLNHATSTDVANGVSMEAEVWYDISTSQNISVTASKTVELNVGGAITCASAYAGAQSFAVRLLVDGTDSYPCAGQIISQNQYSNPLAGAVPVIITGLSAGTHTVKAQVLCYQGSGTVYNRSSTYPATEVVRIVAKQF